MEIKKVRWEDLTIGRRKGRLLGEDGIWTEPERISRMKGVCAKYTAQAQKTALALLCKAPSRSGVYLVWSEILHLATAVWSLATKCGHKSFKHESSVIRNILLIKILLAIIQLANFFCKAPDCKYFGFCGLYSLCSHCSMKAAIDEWVRKWMSVAMSWLYTICRNRQQTGFGHWP